MSGFKARENNFYWETSSSFKKETNKKPFLVACDVYRPAAIDQLGIVADQVGAAVYEDREEKNPVKLQLLL